MILGFLHSSYQNHGRAWAVRIVTEAGSFAGMEERALEDQSRQEASRAAEKASHRANSSQPTEIYSRSNNAYLDPNYPQSSTSLWLRRDFLHTVRCFTQRIPALGTTKYLSNATRAIPTRLHPSSCPKRDGLCTRGRGKRGRGWVGGRSNGCGREGGGDGVSVRLLRFLAKGDLNFIVTPGFCGMRE
jgi:hypothetical protein